MTSASRSKNRPTCALPAPPAVPPGPFKLFIRFPSDTEDAEDTRVHSITVESESVSVTALKARIELLLGLPGSVRKHTAALQNAYTSMIKISLS